MRANALHIANHAVFQIPHSEPFNVLTFGRPAASGRIFSTIQSIYAEKSKQLILHIAPTARRSWICFGTAASNRPYHRRF